MGLFQSLCISALIVRFVPRLRVGNIACFQLPVHLQSLSISTNSHFRTWYTPGLYTPGASQDQACTSKLELGSCSCKITGLDLKTLVDSSSCCHAEEAVDVARVKHGKQLRKKEEESRLATCSRCKVESQRMVCPQVDGKWVCTMVPETCIVLLAERNTASSMAMTMQSLERATTPFE